MRILWGTVRILGQNAEHERITRHALGCGQAGGPDANVCFRPGALDEIAGKGGTYGAVGWPDNPLMGKIYDPASHCDDGDYLDTPGYPHPRAQAQGALEACRGTMAAEMNEAVADAARLVKNHALVGSEIPTVFACTFGGSKDRAYCDVLQDFGAVLHAAQDFYAHSNWVDQPDTSKTVGIANPPGLSNSARAPWLDLRRNAPFPAGLMTGCFLGNLPDGVSGCAGRVTHFALNKDKGTIDPQIGAGTTSRGMVGGNFKRAVEAANRRYPRQMVDAARTPRRQIRSPRWRVDGLRAGE